MMGNIKVMNLFLVFSWSCVLMSSCDIVGLDTEWKFEEPLYGGLKPTHELMRWHPLPSKLKVAFQTNAACEVYPMYNQETSNVTLLCNSVKIRNGSPLTLGLYNGSYTPWLKLWSISSSLYRMADLAKTEVECIDLMPGETEELMVCLYQSANNEVKTITCRNFTVRMFLKYFNIHSEFYYRLKDIWKRVSGLFNLETKRTNQRKPFQLEVSDHSMNKVPSTIIPEEEPECILSNDSARLCNIQVDGNAELIHPFDPYMSTVFVKVMPCGDDFTDNVVINIANQRVNNVLNRQLVLFVNGTRAGVLPQTINLGNMCKNGTSNPESFPPLLLTTLNETSKNRDFVLMNFIDAEQKNYELMSIYGSSEDLGFVKVEEIYPSGLELETEYIHRRPHYIVKRGIFKEVRVLVKAIDEPTLRISVLDKDVDVFINGIKLKSEEYKMIITCRKAIILLKDKLFQNSIIVSCISVSGTWNICGVLWWFYIFGCFVVGNTLQFIDSFTAYKIVGLDLGVKSFGSPGDLLAYPLALFTKDLDRTEQFGNLLLMDACLVCLLPGLLVCLLLPNSWLSNSQDKRSVKLPYLSMLFNCSCVIMVMLHRDVYSDDSEIVYILGHVIPDIYFRWLSLLIIAVTSLVSGCISIRSLFMLFQHNTITYDKVPQPPNLHRPFTGMDGWCCCLLEHGKLYKLHFTYVNGDCVEDGSQNESRYIEITKVSSVTTGKNCVNTNVKFLSIKRNIKGFEDIKLVSVVKLKDLELISLMKKQVRVWMVNGKDTNVVENNQVANTLFVLSTLGDCVMVSVILFLNIFANLGLGFGLFQLLLKLSTLGIFVVLRYKKLRKESVKCSVTNYTSIYNFYTADIMLSTLLGKCIRTIALSIYLYIHNLGSHVRFAFVIDVVKFCLLSWSFHTGFPIIQAHNYMELTNSLLWKIHVGYTHLIAIYTYVYLGWLPNISRRIRYLVLRVSLSTGNDGNDSRVIFHSAPYGIKAPILDLRVLDAFRCVHSLQSDKLVMRNVFLHPSIDLIYADVMPKCTIECYELVSQMRMPVRKKASTDSNHGVSYISDRCTYHPGVSSLNDDKTKEYLLASDYIPKEEVELTNLINDERIGSSRLENTCFSSVLGTEPDSVNEIRIDGKIYNTDCYQRLFGIIEWRSQAILDTPLGKHELSHIDSGNSNWKLHLHVPVGSLNKVQHAVATSKCPTISYDRQKNLLTVSGHFITPLEKYSIQGIMHQENLVKSTNVSCTTKCVNNFELAFELVGVVNKEIWIQIIDSETHKTLEMDPNLMNIDLDNFNGKAIIRNEAFELDREYIVAYNAQTHERNLQFIYHGFSNEVLKEITVPMFVTLRGCYDFVVCDKIGARQRISCVDIDDCSVDKFHFGMKSKVMNPTNSIDLKNHDKTLSYFADNTFYFQGADDDKDLSHSKISPLHRLRVKKCQYLLGDNMSFLIPITVSHRLSSMKGEDLFRVIPHYDVLANDLKLRIHTLQCALRYIQLDLLLLYDSTVENNLTSELMKSETSTSKISDSSVSSMGYMHANNDVHYQSPDVLLNGIIAALFSDETLQEIVHPFPCIPTKFPRHFVLALRTILVFCINQLEEAAAILLRQHDLATSVSVKGEMQYFDSLTRQGMMAENATALLKKHEHYNCFVHFPFVLKSDDIHARVNVGLELERMKSAIHQECRSRDTLFEHDSFIIDSLTQHLLGHIDLRKTCTEFCHIIVPSNIHSKLGIRNLYCFVNTPTPEAFTDHSLKLWIPCFISLDNRRIQVAPSDRVLHGGHIGHTLIFTVVSLESTLSSEPINVLGSNKVMDNQVQVTLRLSETTDADQIYPLVTALTDDGIMILRCHRRLFGFWEEVSRTLPSHTNLDETILFDSTFDVESAGLGEKMYTQMFHRMSPNETLLFQRYKQRCVETEDLVKLKTGNPQMGPSIDGSVMQNKASTPRTIKTSSLKAGEDDIPPSNAKLKGSRVKSKLSTASGVTNQERHDDNFNTTKNISMKTKEGNSGDKITQRLHFKGSSTPVPSLTINNTSTRASTAIGSPRTDNESQDFTNPMPSGIVGSKYKDIQSFDLQNTSNVMGINQSRPEYYDRNLGREIESTKHLKLRSKNQMSSHSETLSLDGHTMVTTDDREYVYIQNGLENDNLRKSKVINNNPHTKDVTTLDFLSEAQESFRKFHLNESVRMDPAYMSSTVKPKTFNDTTSSIKSRVSTLNYRSKMYVKHCVSKVENYMTSYLIDVRVKTPNEIILPDCKVIYKGGMIHHLLDGRGKIESTTTNQCIYEGGWCMNERHGEGSMTYRMANGNQCSVDCRWFKNIPMGRATLVKSRTRGFDRERVSLGFCNIDLGPAEDLCNSDFVNCLYSTKAYHIINNDLFTLNNQGEVRSSNTSSLSIISSFGSMVRTLNRRSVSSQLEGKMIPDCILNWFVDSTLEFDLLISHRISTNIYGKCMDGVSDYFGPINNKLEPHTDKSGTHKHTDGTYKHSTMEMFINTSEKLSSLQLGTFRNKQLLYIGEWHNGLPHGWGFMVIMKESYTYCGEFKWGKRHGLGLERHSDVYYLFGTFFENKLVHKEKLVAYSLNRLPLRYFYGTLSPNVNQHKGGFPASLNTNAKYRCHVVYNNTTQYFGHIQNLYRSGFGVLLDIDGNMIYRGAWKHDLPGGTGISLDAFGLYLGSFDNGKFNGLGIYILKKELHGKFGISKVKGIWKSGVLTGLLEVFRDGMWIRYNPTPGLKLDSNLHDQATYIRIIKQAIESSVDELLRTFQCNQTMHFSVESGRIELLDMVSCITAKRSSFIDYIFD